MFILTSWRVNFPRAVSNVVTSSAARPFYVDGNIFLTLTPVGLALKLPSETRDGLLEAGEAVPLRYFPDAPIKKAYALFRNGFSRGGSFIAESIQCVINLNAGRSQNMA